MVQLQEQLTRFPSVRFRTQYRSVSDEKIKNKNRKVLKIKLLFSWHNVCPLL